MRMCYMQKENKRKKKKIRREMFNISGEKK